MCFTAITNPLATAVLNSSVEMILSFLKDSRAWKWQMTKRMPSKHSSFHLRNMGMPVLIVFIVPPAAKLLSTEHVANMLLGADVCGLETETPKWVTELFSNSKRLKRRIVCHRLILDTVARDSSTRQRLSGARYFYPVLPMLLKVPVTFCFLKVGNVQFKRFLYQSLSMRIESVTIPRSQLRQHNDR